MKNVVLGIVILVGGYFVLSAINAKDDKRAAARQAKALVVWNKWVEFRDSECELVSKVYGGQVQSGKFTFTVNANGYKCSNGITYFVPMSLEQAGAEGGVIDQERIPVIE